MKFANLATFFRTWLNALATLVELIEAGVPVYRAKALISPPVLEAYFGIIQSKQQMVVCQRHPRFWLVHLHLALRYKQALELHQQFPNDLLVDGKAGLEPPHKGVRVYHVYSQEAFNALIKAIKETTSFGSPSGIPLDYLTHPLLNWIILGTLERTRRLSEEQFVGLQVAVNLALGSSLGFEEAEQRYIRGLRSGEKTRQSKLGTTPLVHAEHSLLNFYLRTQVPVIQGAWDFAKLLELDESSLLADLELMLHKAHYYAKRLGRSDETESCAGRLGGLRPLLDRKYARPEKRLRSQLEEFSAANSPCLATIFELAVTLKRHAAVIDCLGRHQEAQAMESESHQLSMQLPDRSQYLRATEPWFLM